MVFAAFLALLAGCAKVDNGIEAQEGEGLRVTINCGTDTKVTKKGVGNENLIKTVDYFLFSNSGSEYYRYKGHLEPNVDTYFTFYIKAALINTGTYSVYVIVNYPGDTADLGVNGTGTLIDESDKRTRGQLNALLLNESVARTFTKSGVDPADETDLALVMTGLADNVVVSAQSGQALVGTASIDLSRLAAKVTMDFYIKDKVTKTNGTITETWEPLTDGNNIRVYLCNANQKIYLSGAELAPTPANADRLFDYQPNLNNKPISGKTDYAQAFSSAAFYTYPNSWTYGDADEPYLKLIIPWKLTRSTGTVTINSQKEFYYKVMLPANTFTRNNWYNLKLDVSQLGSDSDDDAVMLQGGYQVADWGTEQIVLSTLAPGYFLDVNETIYDMTFYGDDLDIPYFASGDVSLTSVTIKKTNFTSNTEQIIPNSGFLTLEEDYVAIRHPLNTNFSGTAYDVSPYTYTFTLHLDAAGASTDYDRTVTVHQYPPLFIKQIQSDGHVFVNGNPYHNGDRLYDDSIVVTPTIPNLSSTNADHNLGTVVDPAGVTGIGDNNNQHILEIQATIINFQVDFGSGLTEVVLGDPRSKTPENFGGNFTELTGSYYPTADNVKNVVSPRFRVASSYGKTTAVTFEGAKRRCAAYQENGYPAGRWRLPTVAEIYFMVKLSDDGKIPSLFGSTDAFGYWAGSGMVRFSDGIRDLSTASYTISNSAPHYYFDGKDHTCFTRCVYDTWYWGSEPDSSYDSSSPSWLGYKTSL